MPSSTQVRSNLAAAAKKHPDMLAAVSRLAWLQCHVGPMKSNDNATLAAFDKFFARTDLVWVELSKEVVELAAAIRVKHGLKTPDALQAASCLQLGADHLFSVDVPACWSRDLSYFLVLYSAAFFLASL